MKKQILILMAFSFFAIFGCKKDPVIDEKGVGYLTLNISPGSTTKAGVQITDFTLKISNSEGREIIKELISDLPSQISLTTGTYTIEAYSSAFSAPQFETPYYSGKTTVEIVTGQTSNATLVCEQSNASVKIVWSDEFSEKYQDYHAEIYSETGNLIYSSTETRAGYFLPGTVSIIISAGSQTFNGGTIVLATKDMVTTTLQPKSSPSGLLAVTISIQEVSNQREIEIIVDPDSVINSADKPYSIPEAIAKQGKNGVWVAGYIVGAKPSSGWDFLNSETWQMTNIVLAENTNETSDSKCIVVELPSGKYRTNLNLVDHPELLHKKILIKGNLATYQSRPGLRVVSDYSIK